MRSGAGRRAPGSSSSAGLARTSRSCYIQYEAIRHVVRAIVRIERRSLGSFPIRKGPGGAAHRSSYTPPRTGPVPRRRLAGQCATPRRTILKPCVRWRVLEREKRTGRPTCVFRVGSRIHPVPRNWYCVEMTERQQACSDRSLGRFRFHRGTSGEAGRPLKAVPRGVTWPRNEPDSTPDSQRALRSNSTTQVNSDTTAPFHQ